MTRRRWFYLIIALLILLPVGVGIFYGHRIWQWRELERAGVTDNVLLRCYSDWYLHAFEWLRPDGG
ncbi:MAG: hypothetical protein AAF226_07335, partial [Verrucomicrobiota bacterium]